MCESYIAWHCIACLCLILGLVLVLTEMWNLLVLNGPYRPFWKLLGLTWAWPHWALHDLTLKLIGVLSHTKLCSILNIILEIYFFLPSRKSPPCKCNIVATASCLVLRSAGFSNATAANWLKFHKDMNRQQMKKSVTCDVGYEMVNGSWRRYWKVLNIHCRGMWSCQICDKNYAFCWEFLKKLLSIKYSS